LAQSYENLGKFRISEMRVFLKQGGTEIFFATKAQEHERKFGACLVAYLPKARRQADRFW